MKRKTLASILLSAWLVLSACNLPGASAPNSSALSTSAAQTVQAVLSPAATQPLTTSAASITSTPAAACKDTAKFTAWTRDNVPFDVNEVNKLLAPGKVFTMGWTLENTGTCTWTSDYQMYFDSGTILTEAGSFPVIPKDQTVAGGTINVSIPMTAPDKAGEYQSVFELRNLRAEAVIILGVTTKVGTPSQSLASPGDLKYSYDCTTGSVNISLSWTDKSTDEDGFRIYRDADKLADVPAGTTAYYDIAPASGTYDYTVAAFNESGEAPAKVKVDTKNCQ